MMLYCSVVPLLVAALPYVMYEDGIVRLVLTMHVE